MDKLHKLKSDIQQASPITLVILGVLFSYAGAFSLCVMKQRRGHHHSHHATKTIYAVYAFYCLVLGPLIRTLAGLAHTALRSSKESKPAVERDDSKTTSLASESSNAKRGKGLKQLLKETKQARAAAHSYEKLPDSALYLNTLKGHGDSVVSVEISADNRMVLTASEDKVVRIYDMKGDYTNTKPALARIPLKETPQRAMFWGGQETVAACTAGLGQVANLFTVVGCAHGRTAQEPKKVAERMHDGSEVIKACSVPNSKGETPLLATLTRTKEAKVTGRDGKLLATVHPSGINNYQIVLSRDGRFLAVTTWACDMKIWELSWGRDKSFSGCVRAMELKGHTSGITSVAFNEDASRAATSSKDGTLRVWNLNVRYQQSEDPKCLLNHHKPGKPFDSMAWCDNGTLVATQGSSLHFLDSSTGRVISSIAEAHANTITGLCVSTGAVRFGSTEGYVAVTGAKDQKARVWAVPEPDDS